MEEARERIRLYTLPPQHESLCGGAGDEKPPCGGGGGGGEERPPGSGAKPLGAPGRTPPARSSNKRAFLRPGSVGAVWARALVGSHKTVSVGRRRSTQEEDAAPRGGGAGGGGGMEQPRSLADISAFLHQHKRCDKGPTHAGRGFP